MFPKLPSNTLIFDIEAGGLSGHHSSILSIAHGKLTGKVGAEYASPTRSSRLYEFSQTNVWDPIKRKVIRREIQLQTEQEILSNFLVTLKAHKGQTIAGWNIGYQPFQQNIASTNGPRGFDIPMLMTRAKKYGLEKEYQEAFRQVKIRDLGREFAFHVATEVEKYPELVDPDLYAQAKTYSNLGRAFQNQVGTTSEDAARALALGQYQFAGWKQEQAYELLLGGKYAAHDAKADVEAIQELVLKGQLPEGPDFVKRWNQLALDQKVINTERAAKTESYRVVGRLGQNLGPSGKPRMLRNVLGEVAEFGFKHRVPLALGAAALGLYALQPLSLFSGKDDNYNTIEGLPHRGIAQRLRRLNTDFGSGYQGTRYSGDMVTRHLEDNRISPEEWREIAREMQRSADQNLSMQMLTPGESRRVFDQYLRWKDPQSAAGMAPVLTESPQGPGLFGWYQPQTDELAIASAIDPRDAIRLARQSIAAGRHFDKIGIFDFLGQDARPTGLLYRMLNPANYKSTIVHEGLHGVYEHDVPDEEKRVFEKYFEENVKWSKNEKGQLMMQASGDVATLANKSPFYNMKIQLASMPREEFDRMLGLSGSLLGDDFREMMKEGVTTELFAHLGEHHFSPDEAHPFFGNKQTKKIVRQYINVNAPKLTTGSKWPKVDLGLDEAEGILNQEIGWWTGVKANLLDFGRMWTGETAFNHQMFSGFDDAYNTIRGLPHGGMSQASRRLHTEFGSGWRAHNPEEPPPRFVESNPPPRFVTDSTNTETEQESGMSPFLKYYMAASVLPLAPTAFGGLGVAYHSAVQDMTGRATFYHGSTAEAKESILKEGIRAAYSHGEGSLTRDILGKTFADTYKGLIYTTGNIGVAASYAGQAHARSLGTLRGTYMMQMVAANFLSGGLYESIAALINRRRGTVKISMPINDAIFGRRVSNPEGGISAFLSTTFEGDIDARYIVGSKEYQKLTMKEISEHYARNPAMFVRGVGKMTGLALGLGLTAGFTYNYFSGKDDAHNTIEGLPHGGLAESSRRMHTDFGSGWVGEILSKGTRVFKGRVKPTDFKPLWSSQATAYSEESMFEDYDNSDLHMYRGDDQYNTIEGLRHGGMSGALRKESTDFGSGFVRRFLSKAFSYVKKARPLNREWLFGASKGSGTYISRKQIVKGMSASEAKAERILRRENKILEKYKEWQSGELVGPSESWTMSRDEIASFNVGQRDQQAFKTNIRVLKSKFGAARKLKEDIKLRNIQRAAEQKQSFDIPGMPAKSSVSSKGSSVSKSAVADFRARFNMKHRQSQVIAGGFSKNPGRQHTNMGRQTAVTKVTKAAKMFDPYK